MSQTSEAVCYTDADARIVDINYAFTRMYGWRADEVIGRTPRILRSGLHPPELYRDMRASLAEEASRVNTPRPARPAGEDAGRRGHRRSDSN